MDIHILPIDDLFEHKEAKSCQCKPKISWEVNNFMVVHNSYDGREKHEKDNPDYGKEAD